VIPGLWLLALVAARWTPNARSLVLIGLGFLALNFSWPLDWPIDPRFQAVASLITLALMVSLTIRALRPSGLLA